MTKHRCIYTGDANLEHGRAQRNEGEKNVRKCIQSIQWISERHIYCTELDNIPTPESNAIITLPSRSTWIERTLQRAQY